MLQTLLRPISYPRRTSTPSEIRPDKGSHPLVRPDSETLPPMSTMSSSEDFLVSSGPTSSVTEAPCQFVVARPAVQTLPSVVVVLSPLEAKAA